MMKRYFCQMKLAFLGGFLFFSCKNDSILNGITVYNSDGTPKRKVAADIRDSVYFYAETAYLWYKNLPNSNNFDPLKYSSPEEVISGVRTFSEKKADGTNKDKWSFVMDKSAWDAIASGSSKNFGAYYRFAANGDLFVRQVFEKSSAGIQDVKRGWKVMQVNGISPSNTDSFISQFNTALSANTVQINFESQEGVQKLVTLTQSDYQTNTIQEAKVFEDGSKKIGYFCFTDFLGDNTSAGINQLFTDFKSKGVNELIIDLRYNGGGYVSIAQELINLIAPNTATGKVMFTYQYNDKLTKYSKSTLFAPSNRLGLNKIVFITTKSSASASELVINSLKPHMDVKIVGAASHGKPVGFPIIPVMNYVVAPVAFKTVNSAGEADYYEGFIPDFTEVDDLTKNFGDPEEKCLKAALEYLKTGKVIATSAKNARITASEKMNAWNEKLPESFIGMYDKDEMLNNAMRNLIKSN